MTEYPWWEPYKFAVLETDRKKLKDRVDAAERAIRARASLNGQVSSDERIAIQDAMSALQMLRRESEQDAFIAFGMNQQKNILAPEQRTVRVKSV